MEEVFKIVGFMHQTPESVNREGDQSKYMVPGLLHDDFYNYEDAKKYLEEVAPNYKEKGNDMIFYFRIEKFFRVKKDGE